MDMTVRTALLLTGLRGLCLNEQKSMHINIFTIIIITYLIQLFTQERNWTDDHSKQFHRCMDLESVIKPSTTSASSRIQNDVIKCNYTITR